MDRDTYAPESDQFNYSKVYRFFHSIQKMEAFSQKVSSISFMIKKRTAREGLNTTEKFTTLK